MSGAQSPIVSVAREMVGLTGFFVQLGKDKLK